MKDLEDEISKLKTDSELYKDIINSNIFIIGGAAVGKTELMQILQKEMSYTAIDVGKLFRLVAYLIMDHDSEFFIKPDIEKIRNNDPLEIERVIRDMLAKTKSLEKSLISQAKFKKLENGKLEFCFQDNSMERLLETSEVNDVTPVIAKSPKIRRIIWKWINKYAFENGGLILTGYNLQEINTSDFIIIHLKADLSVAGERLMKKSESYRSIVTAIQSVENRNNINRVKNTEKILEQVCGVVSIDTTRMSIEDVAVAAVKGLKERVERKRLVYDFFENNALERKDCPWLLNPVMSLAKSRLETLIENEKIPSELAKFDLLMQCLLHLPSYYPQEIFLNWSNKDSEDLHAYLQRDISPESNVLADKKLNDSVLLKIITDETDRLLEIYSGIKYPVPFSDNPVFPDLACKMAVDKSSTAYFNEDICRRLVIPLHGTPHILMFKPVSREIGAEYSYQMHYLHSPRYDEFMGFGAFLDNLPYPIAWVSYAKHDRLYKKELLEHIGLESHNVLEMTRAWNAPWAPKNTMSTLFNYSAKELRTIWENMETKGVTDKSLVGISTTINPNLGFTGKSFSGASFVTTALRPATLTYYKEKDSAPVYITRREAEIIKNNSSSGAVFDARIPQLPLNEMILVYAPKMQEKILNGKIYKINPESYSSK